jgi:hypothetical protein
LRPHTSDTSTLIFKAAKLLPIPSFSLQSDRFRLANRRSSLRLSKNTPCKISGIGTPRTIFSHRTALAPINAPCRNIDPDSGLQTGNVLVHLCVTFSINTAKKAGTSFANYDSS